MRAFQESNRSSGPSGGDRLPSRYPFTAIPTLEGPALSNPTDLLPHPAHSAAPAHTDPNCGAAGVVARCAIRKRLTPSGLAERFSAVDPATGTPTLLYRVNKSSIEVPEPDALRGLLRITTLRHPHLLPLNHVELESDGSIWLVTDYLGSHSGMLTLALLLSQKTSGMLAEREVFHVATHLLSALDAAHRAGFAHGSLRTDDVIVDPRGRTLIELLGVARELKTSSPLLADALRTDLRAVAAIVYELLTGVPSNGERLPLPRALGRAARKWDGWIARALDESSGFKSASEAIAQLP